MYNVQKLILYLFCPKTLSKVGYLAKIAEIFSIDLTDQSAQKQQK